MKKNKRKFLKQSLSFFSIILLSSFYNKSNYFLKNKLKIYKKKYAKVWILDVNDS